MDPGTWPVAAVGTQIPVPSHCSPLISVVVPVYNAADHLDACLGSILGQSFADIEVIAVDGKSDDGSPEILSRWEAQDGRLELIRLDEPGPGRARNVGMERARGVYLWFVDADDTVAAGALAAIADAVGRLTPDVLLIGYDERHPDGSVRHNPGAPLLRAALRPTTLASHPILVNLSMTVWNKLLRREFFRSLDIEFPLYRRHEDVPVSSAALLAADSIVALDRVCYEYHKNQPGALTTSATSDNRTVFESYRQVFELIEKMTANSDPKVTDQVAIAFFERAIQHYAAILSTGGPLSTSRTGARLIPTSYRRAFFALMHRDYVEFRPRGFRRPSGLRGVEFALIEHGTYAVYAALEPLNHLRVEIAERGVVLRRRRGGARVRPPRAPIP